MMEDQFEAGTIGGIGTAVRGACDECGKIDVLTARIDPESPLSDSLRLCPSCARTPEPYWLDER